MKRSVFLIGLMVLGSCKSTSEPLRKEQEWKAQDIHDYQFFYRVSCYCGFTRPNPVLITVHNDVVAKVEDPLSSVSGGVSTAGYPTIDGIFAIISQARSRGADKLDVKYDDAYAFPKSIAIDYYKNAADDEIAYSVENFVKLSAGQQ